MAIVDFHSYLHQRTQRNYRERVCDHDKAACSRVAIQYGQDYWDGDRRYGYGGFRYDGRWRAVAESVARHYHLPPNARILDVGCGKGFLLYEFTQILPDAQVAGLDISEYGIAHAKPEVQPFLQLGNASSLPYPDRSFDFVVSVTTLHNLYNYDLHKAVQEIERVGKGPKLIIVESYRTEEEKANLLYWQLTCRAFHTPEEWQWLLQQAGYTGDCAFIFFT